MDVERYFFTCFSYFPPFFFLVECYLGYRNSSQGCCEQMTNASQASVWSGCAAAPTLQCYCFFMARRKEKVQNTPRSAIADFYIHSSTVKPYAADRKARFARAPAK